MLAEHASLRDAYNPQGMVDKHAMGLLTAGATKPDFDELAVGLGAKGFRVDRPDFGETDKALAIEEGQRLSTSAGDVELPVSWDAQALEKT
jgi:acetolactate synthase I/II/III large subunit